MASRHSRIGRPPNTSRSKAAARPQGIRKLTPPAPRRSPRLLATQVDCQTSQVAERSTKTTNKTSSKRKYDSINQDTPAPSTKKQRIDPIEHWRRQGCWPKELFEPDVMPTVSADDDCLARTISRKRSIGGSSTSTRDLNRDEKAAPYKEPRYEQLLQSSGVFMRPDKLGPDREDIRLCKDYLTNHVELPQGTGFADELFEQTIIDCHNKNEARIIRDLGLLVCPSPEDLFKREAITTKYLCESVDEAWKLSRPITQTRPQPDFSVGFSRDAFTEEQLKKVQIVLGNSDDQASMFRATWYMYFPFLGCEAKKGDGALDVADRQNAHSMGMGVRAVVTLFQLAKLEKQLDGQILAFSVSYTDTYVRIYGYYPQVNDPNIKYYRHRIADLALRDSEPQERWKPYRFVKNIYEQWAPRHLQRLQNVLTEMEAVVAEQAVRTGISQIFGRSSVSSGRPSQENLQTESTTPIEAAIPPPTPNTTNPSLQGRDDSSTASKRKAVVRPSKSRSGA